MTRFWLVLLMSILSTNLYAEEPGHGEHGGHSEEGAVLKLTPEQSRQIGLKVETIQLQQRPITIAAPGTVAFNGYALADVTSQVDAVVAERHVKLGEQVKQNQRLVTLRSTSLASAEADFLRADAEYRTSRAEYERLKGLAEQKIVSQARLQQSESAFQSSQAAFAAARASMFAYGLNEKDIDALARQKDYGRLILLAPIGGTIIADDFRVGQHIAAGSLLVQIADESTAWVEARMSEDQALRIRVGQPVIVTPKNGEGHFAGKVVALHHQLDPTTRTAGVRLEVENPDDALAPGMFVDAEIMIGDADAAILLPELAVQRQGSEHIVFVEEEPGHYERREVEVEAAGMGLVVVRKGLVTGERVVTNGSFSLLSELAKSGFEAHSH
ncbi:MAG TPA: efflux RND transporter periplasmic adaptor subunit [Mariprofundaceae bacterium]|nr:efflux RND transporter periplasmic adaptor subunit [Mariprofundaceae bacterium]